MYNIVMTKSTVRHFASSTLSCCLEPSCWNTVTILMSPTDHFPYVNSKVVYQPVGYGYVTTAFRTKDVYLTPLPLTITNRRDVSCEIINSDGQGLSLQTKTSSIKRSQNTIK